MFPLSRRTMAAFTLAPAVALALTACGSPAINTNYTPGAQPTAGSTMPGGPSTAATSEASKSASAKTSSHATAASSATGSGATAHATAPTGTSTSSGGTHTVASPCGWQSGTPSIKVTPCTDLSSGQAVTVQGRGFKPGLRVLAVECAYHGTATTSNDCNVNLLRLPVTKSPNADGTVTLTLIVQKTFRAGGTSFTCSGSTHCIVAVAAPKDTSENATAPIYFR